MATPTIPITDPQFQYVPAAKTDIRETFKRVLAQQRSINKIQSCAIGAEDCAEAIRAMKGQK